MSVEFHEQFEEHRATLISAARRLHTLANAFDRTGNRAVSDELYEIAVEISQSRKAIYEAYSRKVSQEAKGAWEASANILKACIAGTQLGKAGSS